MRAMLTAMLLLVAILLVYSATVAGEDGMKSRSREAGSSVGDYIRGMSP